MSTLENINPRDLFDTSITDQALDDYVDHFNQHRQIWGELLDTNLERLRKGSASLHWLDTDGSNWGTKVKASSRGLTMADINRPKGLRRQAGSRHLAQLRPPWLDP